VASEFRGELDLLRAQLERLKVPAAAPRLSTRPESVACPNMSCGKFVVVPIGAAPGDTASGYCPNCNTKFNVHRRADRTVFTRPIMALEQFNMLSPGDPYSRIWRYQQFKLVEPKLRNDLLVTFAEQLEVIGKSHSWDQLESLVQSRFSARGISVDPTE